VCGNLFDAPGKDHVPPALPVTHVVVEVLARERRCRPASTADVAESAWPPPSPGQAEMITRFLTDASEVVATLAEELTQELESRDRPDMTRIDLC